MASTFTSWKRTAGGAWTAHGAEERNPFAALDASHTSAFPLPSPLLPPLSFKATFPYQPYFFLKVEDGAEAELEQYLRRKYGGRLASIEQVWKVRPPRRCRRAAPTLSATARPRQSDTTLAPWQEDLDLNNHLVGLKQRYVKLIFNNVQVRFRHTLVAPHRHLRACRRQCLQVFHTSPRAFSLIPTCGFFSYFISSLVQDLMHVKSKVAPAIRKNATRKVRAPAPLRAPEAAAGPHDLNSLPLCHRPMKRPTTPLPSSSAARLRKGAAPKMRPTDGNQHDKSRFPFAATALGAIHPRPTPATHQSDCTIVSSAQRGSGTGRRQAH